jgi:hypothetical protein
MSDTTNFETDLRPGPESSVFILGANDPEMARIEAILKDSGLCFEYAQTGPGERVNPRTAYGTTLYPLDLHGMSPIYIECEPFGTSPTSTRIDHHRAGDYGYDLKPEDYARAASIGQLSLLLDFSMEHPDKLLAAMDHCFGAAIKGECPGIAPEDVLELKIESIVRTHGVSYGKVQRLIGSSLEQINAASEVEIGEFTVKDLRTTAVGTENSLAHLAMITAQAISGNCILLTETDSTGLVKVTLRSHITETIKQFMSTWAHEEGLGNIYGVPNRGYAGAWISR